MYLSRILALSAVCAQLLAAATPEELQTQGVEILQRVAEVNRFWLIAPPDAVQRYSYDFGQSGEEPRHFDVPDPRGAEPETRCAVTYNTAMRVLVQYPEQAIITAIEKEGDALRLDFRFDDMLKGAVGTGLAGRWFGYSGYGVTEGSLWLDPERHVPLSLVADPFTEWYDDYYALGEGHFVPLSILVEKAGPGKDLIRYDWKFRVYDPGLWLFDMSMSSNGGSGPAAVSGQATNVRVNSMDIAPRVLAEAEVAHHERIIAKRGSDYAARLIEFNRAWLAPDVKNWRRLAYDYRQEGGYRERVLFDGEGHVLVQLEGTKDGPEGTTRQRLYLPDGVVVNADHGEAWVSETRPPAPSEDDDGISDRRDRDLRTLATGLALDCALTRLARAPEAFRAAVLRGDDTGTFRLELTANNRNTKLFAGTMLAFTSWAYMHDVPYARSEILCDADSFHPLRELDYDRDGNLVGTFRFLDYKTRRIGARPSRIKAILPYEKDGKTQNLEVGAEFAFVEPGLWMLRQVQSTFVGTGDSSTGMITMLPESETSFEPIDELLARLKNTRTLLAQVEIAPQEPAVVPVEPGEPVSVWARADKGALEEDPGIAIRSVRTERNVDGGLQVTVNLVSTAYWTEHLVDIEAKLRDSNGAAVATQTGSATLRAERIPGVAGVELTFPATDTAQDLVVSAKVARVSAAFIGSIWMPLLDAPRTP